jgi:hypothetical protein
LHINVVAVVQHQIFYMCNKDWRKRQLALDFTFPILVH